MGVDASQASGLMHLRDRIGQAALALGYLAFAHAQWRHFQATGHVTGISYVALMLLVVLMAVIRRPARSVAASWPSRIAATVGTYGSLLLRPGGTPLAPDWLTAGLTSVGIAIAILGLVSLRRSFGLFAAHRGVVENGMYQVVRHPLYAGYLMSHVGFILSSPTPWNVLCWLMTDGAQLARIHYEENLLSQDPQYVRYQHRVRWRLLPGVF
jgi:protein-S-isoprenylcysteine O-methyltransferase Ste14